MAAYNRTRYVEQLLEKTELMPPSFTVHLHAEYWVLNNGSKFLYHNQIASLLDDIRAHRIPVDFLDLFDSARVPFYDGCMVVELLDYRPKKMSEPSLKNPGKTRVVLHPSPESLWADICSLNQRNGGKWSDIDTLEVEAKILLATSQSLCLDPDPHLTRIVNNVLRASTPSMPLSLKRKASTMEPEEDGREKAKRERLLGFMAPRDNRLHAPSYRLLDAIEANRQKKEAAKSGAVQHGNQYMPATSQSVQPIPIQVQPSPAPQVLVHAQDPDGQKTPKVELPQTFPVPFRSNGAHTPIPSQSTHQFINQCPSTAPHGSVAQPQVYANLQTAQDAANNQAPTPAQQIHMQPPQIQHYQQHYVQQYQFQSQQSLQQHQATTQTIQPQLSRPPSQPQQQPAQNTSIQPSQSRLSPNTSTQQVVPQQMQPQRFTHTPKPPQVQPTVMQPTQTSQQYSGNANSFQGSAHNTHFLQHSGTSVRPAQKSQSGPIQDSQPPLPPNATPAQVAQAQHIYSQQMNQYNQSQQQQQGQQPGSQRLLLQRMAQSSSGGRTTPAQAQQSPGLQPQQVHQTRAVTATPSPVKGSPVFNQTTVAVGSPAGVSPMQAKAQVPIQQAGNGQQHTQPIQHLQGQQLPNSGPQRIQFQPQYNPSHLRPLIHGNPQTAHASPSGVSVSATPNLAHASPVVGGRPITPVINADIKQPGPGQQLPLRRPTPLQQQATVAQMTQMQAHAQKQQAPQIQVQQLPQAQGQQPFTQSHVPTAPTPPQVQQTPVQQAAQIPNAQQLAAYPQLYNYQMQQFWRNSQQQQLQQGQGQANPAVAAGQASLPQQQVTSMTPQQAAALQHQHQHNLQVALIQQLTQQAQAHGQSLTPSQIQLYVHQKLHMMAQAQAQAGGQQQAQGAQQNQQIGQQAQITPARAQALMMGKIQMPVGSQMYGQQGHVQGGPGQSANMRLQVQQQQAAAVAQAQVGQKGKPVAGLPKKGPTR